ncbi:GTPase Era [Candidatus Phycosocius bacilliformis]|uniref:GTPase Era n=1 Tax=Candidatus Phycosocius bacilliformis TaxID=1445552 RepID=A0A2P2E857_9PROT|nr:GTPase Era [Candidatus Phycosocius bacilliformis]GBF57246.1 GTPase Era [Candidatus Phycosocius bacilliformis]
MSDENETIPTDDRGPTRCGFAAILGAPNAGKSTLVNALVGQKISIVTQKVQTTRFPVRGVALHGVAQIVLVDTPGVFTPKRRLDRAMVASAWGGAADADVLVHVVDAPSAARVHEGRGDAGDKRTEADVVQVLEGLAKQGRKAILALNKVDALERTKLFDLSQRFFDHGVYEEVVMISALKSSGLDRLAELLAARMPEGPWLYPEEQVADTPLRVMAAEITREKVFLRLHEELPYQATVETDAWTERKDGSVRIDQTLYVMRDGHKGIAIGKGGETLKWISQNARKEISEAIEKPVHLFLHVKVRENWLEDRSHFSAMGLDYDV